jgi:hypothetical protein
MLSQRSVLHGLLLVAVALGALLVLERRSLADCSAVANEELSALAGSKVTVASAQLTEEGKVTKLESRECAADAACDIVYFQVSATKPAPLRTAVPTGYVSPKGWSPVAGTASQRTCPNVYEWVEKKDAAQVGRGGDDNPVKSQLIAAPDIATAHAAFKASRRAYVTSSQRTVGAGQMDLAAATAETLQILGQIVVDRASNKAYGLLQDTVERLLDCSNKAPAPAAPAETPAAPSAAAAPAALPQTTKFPATCAAVASLRIQDLAMAPTVLFNAFAKDLVNYIGTNWPGAASKALAAGVFTSAVVPLVAKPTIGQDATIRAIIDGMSSYVASQDDVTKLNASQEAVVLGVVAYAKCVALGDGKKTSLAQCDMSSIVDQLAGKDHDASKPAARILAGRLLSIATATATDKQRVQVAVDTFFDTSCMLELNVDQPVLGCADIDTITNLKVPNLAANDIAFLEASVDAAVAVDSGRLVVVASKYLELVLDQDANLKKKRALRLLGGLLDYGATFADSSSPQDQVSQSKVHDQRTKILESLTTDMTDRTGREGDDIFSLGGALRLVGGARVGANTSGTALYGPISLPLGIAYTHVAKRANICGIHVQLDVFDLGNYVAFDQGPKVKTPDLGDAVSPSLSVGAACGTGLPFVIAPTIGYTPQFQIDPNQSDKRGAWDVGLSVGVHVPLIDLN